MYIPKGILPPLTTSFNEDGSINYEENKQLVNYVIESGVHGVVVGGSTGEYTLLTDEERREVITKTIEDVDGRVPVIAGTSSHRVQDTIDLTNFAAKEGAQAALILPPHYLKTTDKGIVDYFKEVAENIDIGIIVYNYPSGSGVELSPQLVYELSQIDGVVGIKNTTNFDEISRIISVTEGVEDFAVLTGYQHTLLATLALGGDGAICVIPNLIPKEIVKMYDLIVKDNNVHEAAKLNKQYIELYNYVDAIPFPGNLKAGIELIGVTSSNVRKPLKKAEPEVREAMKEILTKIGYSTK